RTEIEPLARHFLREFCSRSGQREPRIDGQVVQMLCDYEWPGNVRELRNVIERAALLANDDVITEHEILLEPQQPESELSDADEFDSDTAVLEVPSAALSGRSERDRIVRALEACGGNQTRAAKMLGMSRRTLINRL